MLSRRKQRNDRVQRRARTHVKELRWAARARRKIGTSSRARRACALCCQAMPAPRSRMYMNEASSDPASGRDGRGPDGIALAARQLMASLTRQLEAHDAASRCGIRERRRCIAGQRLDIIDCPRSARRCLRTNDPQGSPRVGRVSAAPGARGPAPVLTRASWSPPSAAGRQRLTPASRYGSGARGAALALGAAADRPASLTPQRRCRPSSLGGRGARAAVRPSRPAAASNTV